MCGEASGAPLLECHSLLIDFSRAVKSPFGLIKKGVLELKRQLVSADRNTQGSSGCCADSVLAHVKFAWVRTLRGARISKRKALIVPPSGPFA